MADRAALAHSVTGLVVTEVLATVPAVSWDVRTQVRASSPPPLNPLPTHYDAPA